MRRPEIKGVRLLKEEGVVLTKEAGEEAAEDGFGEVAQEIGEDIIEESIDDEGNEEEDRDNKREIFIDESDGEYYLYSASSSYTTNYWSDPNGSGRWRQGFYLTSMPPNAAQAMLNGNDPTRVASVLRAN